MPHARALIALAALALLSCEEVAYCEICEGHDPRRPVAAANVASIRLLHGRGPLPPGATRVYFYERCGIDCSQHIRFDAPLDQARAFARGFRLEHPMTAGADPWGKNPWGGGLPVSQRVESFGWWPRPFPPIVEGGENMHANGDPPVRIALVPHGRQATVWMLIFET